MESVAAAVLSPEFISLVTAHLPGNRSKQTSSKVPLNNNQIKSFAAVEELVASIQGAYLSDWFGFPLFDTNQWMIHAEAPRMMIPPKIHSS